MARFYDFVVYTEKKRVENLRYMHRNPVKRGLVLEPRQWSWSSYRHYADGEQGTVLVNEERRAELKVRNIVWCGRSVGRSGSVVPSFAKDYGVGAHGAQLCKTSKAGAASLCPSQNLVKTPNAKVFVQLTDSLGNINCRKMAGLPSSI
jgi:hypothetical protein